MAVCRRLLPVLVVLFVYVCDLAKGHTVLAKSAVMINEHERSHRTHRCAHSSIPPTFTRGTQQYAEIDSSGRRSRRDNNEMQPIRIHFSTETLQDKPAAHREYILAILERSKEWLQSAIRVSPVQGNLQFHRQCRFVQEPCTEFFENSPGCGTDFAAVPTEHLRAEPQALPDPLPGGAGVPDADVVIYVTLEETALCTGGTLAYAVPCQRDQIDRPTFGHANFCPNEVIPRNNEQDLEHDYSTAVHEILHVLGFSTSSYALFRNEDGSPQTPRCPDADGCTATDNPGFPPLVSGRYAVSPNTLKVSGSVSKLVTPEVVRLGKLHFACDTLDGVEVENEGGSGTVGSHWEKRVMLNEFMVGLISSSWQGIKSSFSLAVLQDSGWYQANYAAADPFVFGIGGGCAATDAVCVQGTENWCTPSNTFPTACTFDRTALGTCDSTDILTDGCAFTVPYDNGRCDNASGRVAVLTCDDSASCKGVTFGSSSACFESSFMREGFSFPSDEGVGCYEYRCVADAALIDAWPNGVLEIKTPDGKWHSCNGNPSLSAVGYAGTLSCPTNVQYLCHPGSIQVPGPSPEPSPDPSPDPNPNPNPDPDPSPDPGTTDEEVLFTAVLAMPLDDFSASKRLAYRTAVASTAGPTVQVGDVEIVSVKEVTNRRHLLAEAIEVETKVMAPAGTKAAIAGNLSPAALQVEFAKVDIAYTNDALAVDPAPRSAGSVHRAWDSSWLLSMAVVLLTLCAKH